jgi:Fur family ferric uptake transcriptional regulator
VEIWSRGASMTRKTSQREAIRRAFEDSGRPLTAQEALERAQPHADGIGIATVYRNLKALVEGGWLATVELAGEPCRYERAALDHHQHFQCSQCQRVFDIPDCPCGVLDDLVPAGFQVQRHEIVLYGTCPDCGAEPRTREHHHEHADH